MSGSGDITVWINSPGGDCVAAAQIYNMLMDYKGNVTVKIDGIAASAASVIAMAGNKVLIMCAVADKKLSSAVGFKGICKKVLIFALVGLGHILDTRVIGAGSVLRTAVIFFYLSNEGISLLENAAHLGLPVPKKLKDVLEQLHKRSEKEDDDED